MPSLTTKSGAAFSEGELVNISRLFGRAGEEGEENAATVEKLREIGRAAEGAEGEEVKNALRALAKGEDIASVEQRFGKGMEILNDIKRGTSADAATISAIRLAAERAATAERIAEVTANQREAAMSASIISQTSPSWPRAT